MSVHVYHAYRQPDGENHCTPLNGRCSHLCLPAPKVNDRSPLISCACPDDLLLQPDGQNCAPDPGKPHLILDLYLRFYQSKLLEYEYQPYITPAFLNCISIQVQFEQYDLLTLMRRPFPAGVFNSLVA